MTTPDGLTPESKVLLTIISERLGTLGTSNAGYHVEGVLDDVRASLPHIEAAAIARYAEALAEAATYAKHGAAMDHLNRAGVMQDPPHGMGTFAECEAPWCVRAQKRLAGWTALAAPAASPEEHDD